MKSKAPQNLLQGQAGVYQVASQLCLRGYNPMFPAVDHGADLVIEAGIRVQVKATRLRYSKVYPQGAYWFHIERTRLIERKQVGVKIDDWSVLCDFAVFWGINENRFWVVPSSELNGHQCLVLGPKLGYVDLDVDEVQRLYQQGLKQEEIAQQLGTTQMTISRRLRGIHILPTRTFCQAVRNCEDRWDLLDLYLSSGSAMSMGPSSSPILEEEKKG